jgi:hypothetical protein
VFGYFLAIRQFVWVLPAAAVLAAAGFEHRRRTAAVLAVALLAVSGVKSYKYFRTVNEDWEAAARALGEAVAGAQCASVDTPDQSVLYQVFEKNLKEKQCAAPPARGRMVLAISPYAARDSHPLRQLKGDGFRVAHDRTVGGTRIVTLER